MFSAAEEELGALFLNAKEAVPILTTMIKNELATTSHSHPSVQLHSGRNSQSDHQAENVQIHGHAVLLGYRQNKARTVQGILATRQHKYF